jgi:type 1 fimbria pilin
MQTELDINREMGPRMRKWALPGTTLRSALWGLLIILFCLEARVARADVDVVMNPDGYTFSLAYKAGILPFTQSGFYVSNLCIHGPSYYSTYTACTPSAPYKTYFIDADTGASVRLIIGCYAVTSAAYNNCGLSLVNKFKGRYYSVNTEIGSNISSYCDIETNSSSQYSTKCGSPGSQTSLPGPNCNVSLPNGNMPLGDIFIRDFKGPGTTAGAYTYQFTIECAKSVNGTMSIAGVSANPSTMNALALNEGGATNVGVVMSMSDKTLPLNTSIELPVNQGINTVSLTAKYIQLASGAIGSGVGNASATLTVTMP